MRACAHESFDNIDGLAQLSAVETNFSVAPAMCRLQNYYGFYYLDETSTQYSWVNSVLAGFDRWPAAALFFIEAALRQLAQLSFSSIEGAETTSVEIYSPTHSLSLFVAATIRHTVASNPYT